MMISNAAEKLRSKCAMPLDVLHGWNGWIDTGEVHLTADILSNTMYFRLRPCKIQRAFFLATVVCRVIIIYQPRAREYSTAKNTTQIRGYLP